MSNSEDKTESHGSTKTQEAVPHISASSAGEERMFHCLDCNHDLPISEALYPTKTNPTVCKGCAAERRKAAKDKAAAQQQQYTQSLEAIPAQEHRGGSKRMTLSLSRYTVAALEVLSVGSSASEVVEEALLKYLASQDAEVIAFASRVFARKQ